MLRRSQTRALTAFTSSLPTNADFTKRLIKMHKFGGLETKVEYFVAIHIGDELSEERQNTKMHKNVLATLSSLDKVRNEQEKALKQLAGVLDEQVNMKGELVELNANVATLLEKHEDDGDADEDENGQ